MLAEFLKKLRLKNGYNQTFVASHIGVSRPTYLEIEKGTRDLTVTEANKLADFYGLSLDSLLNQKDIILNISEDKKEEKVKNEIRIDIPQDKVEKMKEVLLYVLSRVGAKPNVGMTVLYKLLYFIDFNYYEKYEDQLIGATYIKNHFGPTPIYFSKIVEDMKKLDELEEVKSQYFLHDQKKFLPKRPANLSKISANELQMIEQVLSQLSDKTAKELSDFSHTDTPWMVKKQGEVLDYESVFYRDVAHSVRDNSYDQL